MIGLFLFQALFDLMRSLVDFLIYEVALGHWCLIIIGLFSRENMVCNMLCSIKRLLDSFLRLFERYQ